MTDDAKFLLSLFKMQLEYLEEKMLNKMIRRDEFDELSYSATAMRTILKDVNECECYKDVSLIRHVIIAHLAFYDNAVEHKNKQYKYFKSCLETAQYMYELTGGYEL